MKFSLVLMLVLISGIVSATPQIFRTNIDVTLNGTVLTIDGEQINISENLNVGNGSIDYFNKKYEILIVRDIGSSTDVGMLLAGLIDSLNYTSKWEECINLNRELHTNLTLLSRDYRYEENYTTCKEQLISCEKDVDLKNSEIKNLEEDLNGISNQRIIWGIIGAGIVFVFFTIKGGGLKRFKEEKQQFPERDKV